MTRHAVAGLVAAIVGLAALPGTAGAHSVVRMAGDTLTYLSRDATSLNTLVVDRRGGRIRMHDRTVDGGIDPGTCDPGEISADANAWIVEALCPRAPVRELRIDLGEREDRASVDLDIDVTLLGGPGADTLTAGAGDDTIDGGPGRDTLDGGAGDDVLMVADGLADRVTCGPGHDRVDADPLDSVAADCEDVVRRPVTPAEGAGAGDDTTAPRVEAAAAVLQRLGRRTIRLLATSSERGSLAASGFLNVGGINLPLQSNRRELDVAGGGARLTVRLTRRHVRRAARALRRGRRVTVRMWAVATDVAGNSRKARAVRIRLRR